MTVQRSQLTYEVDYLSSVVEKLSVSEKKIWRELTGARPKIKLVTEPITARERSAEEAEWRANDAQYELDGAQA